MLRIYKYTVAILASCDSQVPSGSPFTALRLFMASKTSRSFSNDDDSFSKKYDSLCVFEAGELARALAADGEDGFGKLDGFSVKPNFVKKTLLNQVFHRLSTVAKKDFTTRKMASFCGGVDVPMVAYVGEVVYAEFAKRLLAHCVPEDSSPASLHNAYDWLGNMKDNDLGDVVKASLAAASVAFEIERNNERNDAYLMLNSLCRGAHGDGDAVTHFIVEAIIWEAKWLSSHDAGDEHP
jgi:hypothetical protein